MKKNLNNYCAVVILFVIIHNIFLFNLKVSGTMYCILMVSAVLINIFILKKYNQDIKYKTISLVISIFLLIFSKDIYHAIFIISNIVSLFFLKILSGKFTVFWMWSYILLCPLGFIFIIIMTISYLTSGQDIYEETHYYCKHNYEIYSYSDGAMDHYYSIGKYYVFLDFGDIISISYHTRNEKTSEEYEKFLENYKCTLVGEKNGFK